MWAELPKVAAALVSGLTSAEEKQVLQDGGVHELWGADCDLAVSAAVMESVPGLNDPYLTDDLGEENASKVITETARLMSVAIQKKHQQQGKVAK